MEVAPLILTLALDDESQAFFDTLRQKYFPPERNFLRAHCTLLHALPGEHEAQILADLQNAAALLMAFELAVGAPKFIGRGVAFPLEGKEVLELHTSLQKRWRDWLTPQDRQGLWPHITVQNKVAPDEARATQTILAEAPTPKTATATGLQLWRYLRGPWSALESFQFTGTRDPT